MPLPGLNPGRGGLPFVVNDVKIKKGIAIKQLHTDCKSAAYSFGGSNPPSPTKKEKS